MARYIDVTSNPLATKSAGVLLCRFSIPAVISMLVDSLYNVVDQIYIGHGIGMLGIAATNVAFPLTIICTSLSLLIGIGCAANFNLNMGAGKKERAAHILGVALSLLAIAGAVYAVFANLFLGGLLTLLGMTEQIAPYAMPYGRIVSLGFPFLIFATASSHIIRADGSPFFSMSIMLSGAIFNIIFDPIFLFVFDMGIEGIALATTLGQMLSAGLALYYFRYKFKNVRIKRAYLRPSLLHAKAIAGLGVASFVNQLAMMLVQVTLNNTLRHYGQLSVYGSEIPLASVGMIMKTNALFMALIIGIAQGSQPINGFNYGAGNYGRVKRTFKLAVSAATCVAALALITFQLFPHVVAAAFGAKDPEHISFSVRWMRIFMLMTFANGVQPIVANFFTSIGRAKLGVIMSLTRQGIFLLPLIIFLPSIWGIDGMMFAGPIADSAALLTALFLVRGEFRRMSSLEEGKSTVA